MHVWSQIYIYLHGEELVNATANTQDVACLGITANGVWECCYEKTYCDGLIFNPNASTSQHDQLSQYYGKHKRIKKRAFEQTVEVVHAKHVSFIPLVVIATDGMANQETYLYQRLSSLLPRKWDLLYSPTLALSSMQCMLPAEPNQNNSVLAY